MSRLGAIAYVSHDAFLLAMKRAREVVFIDGARLAQDRSARSGEGYWNRWQFMACRGQWGVRREWVCRVSHSGTKSDG